MKFQYKILVVLGLFFLLVSCNNSTDKQLAPPNIVWIVSEDNSPLLGCYGDSLAITPNIDKLAEEGILFENAFSNAPVCAPSRSTMITGMYPTSLGSQHMRSLVEVPKDVKFFPRYLKEAGYYTTLRLKRDYNIPKQKGTWDKDDFWHLEDALKDKNDGQPFFMFYNTWMSHESKIHNRTALPKDFRNTFENDADVDATLATFHDFDPEKIRLPEYQPDIPEMRDDWAWYYKAIEMMDYEVGRVLKYLKDQKLMENTIVIYSSDHGGVLGRSKRFDYESGLHIPMVIWFPEKYKHLAAKIKGKTTNRIVSFVDMAPTLLSLANIKKPGNMVGSAFLGSYEEKGDTIAYGFRGRMDETYDMVRTIRDKKFRYIRNYLPYKPNGQHIIYLWKAKSMKAWEQSYLNGNCNALQSSFFEPRLPEELYDISNDPDNVYNLANDSTYALQLKQFRRTNLTLAHENLDTGFFPEGELWKRSDNGKIPYKEVIEKNIEECTAAIDAAEKVTLFPDVDILLPLLKSKYAAVRFWGATGCIILEENAAPLKDNLIQLLKDPSGDVAITSAEALYLLGDKKTAIHSLSNALSSDNKYVQLRALNIIANRNISDKNLYKKIKNLDKSDENIKKMSDYITEN